MFMKKEKRRKDKVRIIGVDGRCLLDANYTGVSEYTVFLLKKILRDYPNYRLRVFVNSFHKVELKKKLPWLYRSQRVEVKHYRIPNKLLNFSFWFFGWPKLDKLLGGFDLLLVPNISFLAVSKDVFFILTIHDLSFERWPETFSRKRRWWHFFVNPRRLVQRANEIWTVSDSTRSDLVDFYGVQKEKVKVKNLFEAKIISGTNKLDERRKREVRKKYNLPDKFALYLGTIEPRKNILTLLKTFVYLWEKKLIDQRCKLVLAGQLGWKYGEVVKFIEKSPWRRNIILTEFIESKDKRCLYAMAELFVYPSLFEGFGIPVLEAMATGTPVIAGDNSSLPEVIGSAGIMVDVERIDELAEAIRLILNNPHLADYYRRKGRRQAQIINDRSAKTKLFAD